MRMRVAASVATVAVYGTLRDPDVRAVVMGAGWRSPGIEGRLDGWRTVFVRGAAYPGLRRAVGGSATVEIFRAVPVDVLRWLDLFEAEGEDYRRHALTVATGEGHVEAQVYVPTPRLPLTGVPWHYDAVWRQRHKNAFVRRARRVMATVSGRSGSVR